MAADAWARDLTGGPAALRGHFPFPLPTRRAYPRVIHVPGNHDEVLRGYCRREIAGVELMRETVHETTDGQRR
ncbi:MAG: hypothetical protein JSR55_16390 [Proteobacteria bacterium]|nr:hypothetical protein [Pseudomonadota bacterium]